jgi:D-alanyl-D-alanine carboxypeptidase (penicillin-binding protein 5/6)
VYRRRRRALTFAVALALLICLRALTASGSTASDKGNSSNTPSPADRTINTADAHAAARWWPARGQAALVVGSGRPQASPGEEPVPIASVTKVMTAYLVLKRYPLSGSQSGFTVTVTAADEQAEAQDAAENQSVAAVQTGERLTERQMLEELLLPSGNNIARMLGVTVGGTETHFIAEMNAEARALGMTHTTYTDPSGWDQRTVSTAADQLRIFQQATRFAAFRQIVSMPSATLPVAGTVTNTNPILADGFYGKTGSDSAAGACLAFFTHLTVSGHTETAAGVVLGQWQAGSTAVILSAAGQAAEQLVGSVSRTSGAPTISAPPVSGGQPGRRQRSLAPARARREPTA